MPCYDTSPYICTFDSGGAGSLPGGGNPDYSSVATWEAASDNDLAGYSGPVILDCYDSQAHDVVASRVSLSGATNTSSTIYREIRSSASCAIPWAGKEGTGANFYSNSVMGSSIDLSENYSRLNSIAITATASADASYYTSHIDANKIGCKILNCVIYNCSNPSYPARAVGAISVSYGANAKHLIYNTIVKGNTGPGILVRRLYGSEHHGVISCTAINNGGQGFSCYNTGNEMYIFNCYGANNGGGDFDEDGWTSPSGWNASKDNTSDLGGYATYYKNGLDLLTSGDLDSDGLATDDDLYDSGSASSSYGRNPYDDLTATSDYYDFFKNDAAGEAISKKDILGQDRPTPDTADVSWNVGASEKVEPTTTNYTDGACSGGIVFGGYGGATGSGEGEDENHQIDALPAGGIVFGGYGGSTGTGEGEDENHQIDGACIGGIVFGGTGSDMGETWTTTPENHVAVKDGAYRINGEVYTLANTMTYEGLGEIAALVDCGAAPATSGYFRYDLLSIDAAGTITVTAGTEATTPVMPSTPANEIKLNHVLRYYEQERITQPDIGRMFQAQTLVAMTATVADDELAWAETTTTITLAFQNQYGVTYTGTKTVTHSFLDGNGTVTPASKSGTGSLTFTYARGGNDPGDESPTIQFSSTNGATAVVQITLLDASGNIMV